MTVLIYASCVTDLIYAEAVTPWQQLPPTPSLPPPHGSGNLSVNGVSIWYADYGSGEPVFFLHGGLANSNYWANQITALENQYHIFVIDSRGHGRSSNDGTQLSYHQLADDAVAVMDHLGIKSTAIIGWSDGAITGLELAMRYPDRVSRLFSFAANYDPSGLLDVSQSPFFKAFVRRAKVERDQLSTQHDSKLLERSAQTMWATQPHYSESALGSISKKTWIVDGDHDEAINKEHTRRLANLIPGAKLIIEPNVSHFAFLQAPDRFNSDMKDFLAEK